MSKKRKRLRMIRIIVYSILFLIILSAILSFVFFSGVFAIKDITVLNNNKVDSDTVIKESGIKLGENIFLVKESKVRESLRSLPYIENISLKKVIPNRIGITIEERSPSYLIKSNDNYYSIDNNGLIFEKVENLENNTLQIIVLSTNIEEDQIGKKLKENDISKIKIIEEILMVAESNGVQSLITKIDASNDQDIVIELLSESKIAHLGSYNDDVNLNVKFFWLKAMLEQEKGKSGIIYLNVDLSKNKVVFSEQNI